MLSSISLLISIFVTTLMIIVFWDCNIDGFKVTQAYRPKSIIKWSHNSFARPFCSRCHSHTQFYIALFPSNASTPITTSEHSFLLPNSIRSMVWLQQLLQSCQKCFKSFFPRKFLRARLLSRFYVQNYKISGHLERFLLNFSFFMIFSAFFRTILLFC